MVSLATPLLSANSSWLITAPCRMRRKRGRSMLLTSKTLQITCTNPTTMLLYLSIACWRRQREIDDEFGSPVGRSLRYGAESAWGADHGHLLAAFGGQDRL